MNRPSRRPRSPPPFGMGGHGFEPPKQSPIPIDYNDIDRQHHQHHQPHPQHHHQFTHNQAPYPYQPTSPASSQSHNYQHHNHQLFNNNHHGISNNNNNFDQNGPNSVNPAKQHYQHHHNQPNYPSTYQIDQHLPSTYRSTMREQPLPSSSPPPSMVEPNSIYKILCITNINPEVSDATVKEAISNEFSRFGDNSVSICHDGGERLVYIYFKTFEEARDARHSKLHTILFDRSIDIEPIYELRPSPVNTPQAPIFPARRRSMTPPEYYADNGNHVRRSQGPPGPPPIVHNEVMGPSGYPPYPHRYPNRSAPPPPPMHPMANTMPYNDRNYPEPIQYPQHHPYSLPPGDPHRQYPSNPAPNRYSPVGPSNPPPTYGHPPYRDRERGGDPYYTRSPRPPVDHYNGPDHRSYPPPLYNRAPIPPAGGYGPIDPHVPYRSSNVAPAKRSPAYPEPPGGPAFPPSRYSSRDFRREKFRENHLHEREESKPSRVIFVTNIDPAKIESEIKEMFEVFGIIEDLEVKKISPDLASAIIKFSSMDCAYRAKTSMNGKYIGSTKARITYGKVNASRRLWLGGLGPNTTLESLDEEFAKFGDIISLDYVSGRPYGYIEYETPNQAQFAVMHLKGTLVAGADKRIRMEYVDSADRKEGSVKNESNSQTSSKTSQYRGNEIWNNNDSEECDQLVRKRSISPNDLNPKRVASTNHETETGYYDSANRASTSSITKSSNRSSTSSPALERSALQDTGSDGPFQDRLAYGLENHDDPVRSDHRLSKKAIPKKETFAEKVSKAATIESIVDLCDISWNAQLILRNFNFHSTLYMCSGQQQVIDKYINPSGADQFPILRITQRWRLHPQPKLEEVRRHMQTGNLGIFIIKSRINESPSASQDNCKTPQGNTTPSSRQNGDQEAAANDKANSGETSATQSRPLKNLISYLEQKDAAGVVSVAYNDSDGQEHQKLLYTFPPCEFALNILKTVAPKLGSDELSKDEFLIGVLVGTIETKN